MLFQHINRHADKHRKRVYLVLVVVIGLSFVVWVTPRGCDDLGGPNANRRIARVFGKSITQGDFLAATQRANLGHLISTGQWIGGGGSEGEKQLTAITMQRLMAMQEARRLGIDAVSPEEFQDYVKKQFSNNGVFDSEMLANFRTNVTRNLRMTGVEFDRAFKENIVVARLEARAAGGIVVSPAEVRDAFDQDNESFTVTYAEVKFDEEAKGEPADAELEAYFSAHQKDLRLPEGKVARVASLAIPADLATVEVAEEQIKAHYERLKENFYKDKALDDVRDEIRERLARTEARTMTGTKARLFHDELAKRPEGETHEALLERFDTLAESYGATVEDTPAVLPGDALLPGFEASPAFGAEIRSLTPASPILTGSPVSGNRFVLAVLKEIVPGSVPETLDQVREQVADAVLAEKGKTLYAEKVLPHAEKARGLPNANELMGLMLKDSEGRSLDERLPVYFATLRYLQPVFKPEQRTAWVVEFRSADTLREIAEPDQEKIEEHYRSNRDYHTPETRASQILLLVPPNADEETKAEKRKQAEELLARIREQGELFAEVARTASQDRVSSAKGGDIGFAAKGKRPWDIEQALAKLEVGEMSDIVETRQGFAIFQLTDQRDNRPLDETLAKEIGDRLRNQEARLLAQDRAANFADELGAAFEQAAAGLAETAEPEAYIEATRKLFAGLAEKSGIRLVKVDTPFAQNERIGAIGNQNALATAIFGLEPQIPFTIAIDGSTSQYVAMLDSIIPGRFYDLAAEADILLPKLRQIARQEIARETARAEATALREAWLAALAEGGESPPEVAGAELKVSQPFTRKAPDYSMPAFWLVTEKLSDHTSGSLLEPLEHEVGFIVLRLDARTLPAEEAFTQEVKEQQESQLLQIKTNAAIEAFYKRLEEQARPELFGQAFSLR